MAYYEAKKNPQIMNNQSFNKNQEVHYFGDQQQPVNIPQTQNGFNKKLLLIPAAIIIILLILVIAGLGSTSNENSLNVSNVSIVSQGYSMYQVSCNLVPNKDYSYLELVVVFYDSSNSVIGKNSLVWNTNNPVKGQTIKVSGTATTSSSSLKPARAEIYFFDKAFSSNTEDAVYAQNVTM